MRLKKVKIKTHAPFKASDYQTLAERIRWLRVRQKPFMSQRQLAVLARMSIDKISLIESGKKTNITLDVLRRIAHALDCKLFVTIKSKPYKTGEGIPLLSPELPPLPKRKGKTSEIGHLMAAKHGRSYWKNYPRRKRPELHTATSDTAGSADAPQDAVE